MSATKQLKFAEWNIEKGGFSRYDDSEVSPPNEERIRAIVSSLNADMLTLVDIFRWNQYFGGEEGIARALGMQSAFFTSLDDGRITPSLPDEAEIGVIFATNEKVATTEDIELVTRNANRTVLDIGAYGLQVVSAYFDDLDEDLRVRQAKALNDQLVDMPTALFGDFNGLRPLQGARFSEKARSTIIRLATRMLPGNMSIKPLLEQLERREAMNVLFEAGFTDGDPKQRPTALGKVPVFGVDYALSRGEGVSISDVEVLPHKGASDHRILTGTVTVT